MGPKLHEWQSRVLEGLRRGPFPGTLFLEPARGPAAASRFDVYREGYWLRASESLADDFPLVERLLGAAGFTRAMRGFLAEKEGGELELGELSPRFRGWLARRGPAVARAAALDLLAVEARRAPEPEAIPGGGFGLHPSARFHRDGRRRYALWRHEGSVRRERIDARTETFLLAFREPAALGALGERLGALGEEPLFVREGVATWAEAGLLCAFPSQ